MANRATESVSLMRSRMYFVTPSRTGATHFLELANADGSGRLRLHEGGRLTTPSWSPDGQRIAFTDDRQGGTAIYLIKADGSERRRLYRGVCCVGTWAAPIWSPDGMYIAFGVGLLMPDPEQTGIFVMRADGTELRKLATDVAEVTWQAR